MGIIPESVDRLIGKHYPESSILFSLIFIALNLIYNLNSIALNEFNSFDLFIVAVLLIFSFFSIVFAFNVIWFKETNFFQFLAIVLVTLTNLMLVFGTVYWAGMLSGNFGTLLLFEGDLTLVGKTNLQLFFESVYFSGVTLFNLGYGGIVPNGMLRLVSIMESMIGLTYTLIVISEGVKRTKIKSLILPFPQKELKKEIRKQAEIEAKKTAKKIEKEAEYKMKKEVKKMVEQKK